MTLAQDKADLRRRILGAREALSPGDHGRLSLLLRARVMALPEWSRAAVVHLFAPFGSEVDTRPLLQALWDEGRRAVLPRVAPGRRLEHLVVTSPNDLAPGAWSIPEPKSHCLEASLVDLDLILVPGVAFDRQGGRLGYGGGFYDRFLEACPAPRIAMAFAIQMVDVVPRGPHDLPVHAVVTEAEVIRIHGGLREDHP